MSQQVSPAKKRCLPVKRSGAVTILQDIKICGRSEDSPMPQSLPPTPTINLVTDDEDGGRTPAATWEKPTEGEITDEEDRPAVLDNQLFKTPDIRSSVCRLTQSEVSRAQSPAPGPSGLCRPGTSRSRSPVPGPSGLCRRETSRSRSPAPGPSGVSRPEISKVLKMSTPSPAAAPTSSRPASRSHSSGGKNMSLLAAIIKQSNDDTSPARSPASTQDDGESSSDEQRGNVLALLEEERGRREAWQRGVRSVMAKVRRRREQLSVRIAWMRRQLEEDAAEAEECDAAFAAYEQLL